MQDKNGAEINHGDKIMDDRFMWPFIVGEIKGKLVGIDQKDNHIELVSSNIEKI